jgi:hypothetical protein
MNKVLCPKCGGSKIYHYTDAYVLREPVITMDGSLRLIELGTNEYDDQFFECIECGYRPSEKEILYSET